MKNPHEFGHSPLANNWKGPTFQASLSIQKDCWGKNHHETVLTCLFNFQVPHKFFIQRPQLMSEVRLGLFIHIGEWVELCYLYNSIQVRDIIPHGRH